MHDLGPVEPDKLVLGRSRLWRLQLHKSDYGCDEFVRINLDVCRTRCKLVLTPWLTVILRVQLHPPNLCRQCQFMQACNHEEKQCSNPEAKELAECNLSMGGFVRILCA